MKPVRSALICLFFLTSGYSAAAADPKGVTLKLDECQLESSITAAAVTARCGWYEVAENRSAPNGKRIRVHVAVVPALRKQALPDPVFIISGGPGQAASDFYLSLSHAFELLRRERTLVVIDQRGTGKSNRLDCPVTDQSDEERFDIPSIRSASRECIRKLDGDPRFYGTSTAVLDLEDIRKALGYKEINLYGISYGTRVAQHYLRRFPDNVRALVLDGVVPVETHLGPEVAPNAQRTLDAILERCDRQAECRRVFPNVAEEFAALLQRVRSKPISISVADPTTAKQKKVEFTALHMAGALRLHSYYDDTASLLPFLIHEAHEGRPAAMAAQTLLVAKDLNEQLANGMHNAVVCTEDVPFYTKESLADPAIERSYLGRVFVDSLQAICAEWPAGLIDEDFHRPLKSDVPALLLSGENDPITPASYGEQASRSYTKGKHLVVPGQGHGQLGNPCILKLMTAFIQQGSNKSLDTACVNKQAAAPFMLNASSPGP